jgi:hypothetical protein
MNLWVPVLLCLWERLPPKKQVAFTASAGVSKNCPEDGGTNTSAD